MASVRDWVQLCFLFFLYVHICLIGQLWTNRDPTQPQPQPEAKHMRAQIEVDGGFWSTP